MAHITVDEQDYTYLSQAAKGAAIAGIYDLAEGLDKLARKAHAACENAVNKGDDKYSWQDMPSTIEGMTKKDSSSVG